MGQPINIVLGLRSSPRRSSLPSSEPGEALWNTSICLPLVLMSKRLDWFLCFHVLSFPHLSQQAQLERDAQERFRGLSHQCCSWRETNGERGHLFLTRTTIWQMRCGSKPSTLMFSGQFTCTTLNKSAVLCYPGEEQSHMVVVSVGPDLLSTTVGERQSLLLHLPQPWQEGRGDISPPSMPPYNREGQEEISDTHVRGASSPATPYNWVSSIMLPSCAAGRALFSKEGLKLVNGRISFFCCWR